MELKHLHITKIQYNTETKRIENVTIAGVDDETIINREKLLSLINDEPTIGHTRTWRDNEGKSFTEIYEVVKYIHPDNNETYISMCVRKPGDYVIGCPCQE